MQIPVNGNIYDFDAYLDFTLVLIKLFKPCPEVANCFIVTILSAPVTALS